MNRKNSSPARASICATAAATALTVLLASCSCQTSGGDDCASAAASRANSKNAYETRFDPKSQFDAAKFKNPPAQFRCVPFWSWNETMQPDEIRRQIKLMKDAGWGGVMVHSRTGLLTEYLGEDWFKAVDACIDESRKNGIFVWLYDEDKWPSGYSGGDVLKANEDYAVKTLTARPVGAKINPRAKPLGAPKNGIQVYEYRAPQGNPWFNGTSYVDTMSKDAMAEFKKLAYDSYYNKYAKFYGNTIVAEFTDEPASTSRYRGDELSDALNNSVTYSRDLIDAFKAQYGFDPTDHFYKLFADCDGAMKFRLQYYRTLNSLFEKNFVGQIGDACRKSGISLTGHFMCEHEVYGQQLWSGRIMPYYRQMGIPGIDHLGRQISEVYTGKQCSSVCNQFGKTRVLSELYGVSGGSLSFEDRQWIGYQQIILGVNQFVPHLSLFSMTGCRKRDYPQNINCQQSWWPLNAALDVPLARACYAMAQGKYAADILVLNPQESAQAVWKTDPKDETQIASSKTTLEICAKLDASIKDTIAKLLGAQLTFDLGDEQLLEENGSVDGGKISIGQMSYKAVVIPEMFTMRPSTLDKLEKFAAAGGKIVLVGDAPKFLDGEKSRRLDNFFANIKKTAPEKMAAELSAAVSPMIEAQKNAGNSEMLWTHIRNLNDGSRLVMLANLDRKEKFEGVAKLGGGFKKAELLDLESGDITEVYAENKNGRLELPIELHPTQAVFARISNETPTATPAKKLAEVSNKTLAPTAKRLDDNSLTLDYASFSFDGGKTKVDGELPVVEIMNYLNSIKYDGEVSVKYTFQNDGFDNSRKLNLVVEYPENCIVKINGNEVKYAGLPFWHDFRWLPIDIAKFVKNGKNTIELLYKNFKYGDPNTHKPQWRRYGTEIEAVYLVGDFGVNSVDTLARPTFRGFDRFLTKKTNVVQIAKDKLAITNPKPLKFGDATTNGLPFYAGRLAYTVTAETPRAEGERLFVKLDDLDCPAAEVLVDGKRAGVIKSAPFELDITDFVKSPTSKIDVVLYASLRNLMDCPHNFRGDIFSIWPKMYNIEDLPRDARMLEYLKKFADGTWKSKTWVKDYWQITFGNLGKISLITKQPK